MSGLRKLTDRDVAEARRLAPKHSIRELAEKYGVSYDAMRNAVKGYTHRHLNGVVKPQW